MYVYNYFELSAQVMSKESAHVVTCTCQHLVFGCIMRRFKLGCWGLTSSRVQRSAEATVR